MATENITISEWLKELERIRGPKTADRRGWTIYEMKRATGRGDSYLRQRVRAAVEAGLMRCEFRPRPTITGRSQPVPVYVPVGQKKGRK